MLAIDWAGREVLIVLVLFSPFLTTNGYNSIALANSLQCAGVANRLISSALGLQLNLQTYRLVVHYCTLRASECMIDTLDS